MLARCGLDTTGDQLLSILAVIFPGGGERHHSSMVRSKSIYFSRSQFAYCPKISREKRIFQTLELATVGVFEGNEAHHGRRKVQSVFIGITLRSTGPESTVLSTCTGVGVGIFPTPIIIRKYSCFAHATNT